MITINGVTLPTPSECQVGIQDISKAERNARADMIIERIATKRKISLGWSVLTKDQMSTILNAVSPTLFSVSYPDPQTGATKTGTFYSGDRQVPMLDFRNGVPRYKDFKFDIVER